MILAIFDLQSPRCLLASLESIGLSVQEKKRKIDFQDGCHGGHLGFPIDMILAIFDLQVTPMLPSKFGVNWSFGSGEEAKNRFSRWRPSWIPIGTILAIFDLQVTPMLLPSLESIGLPVQEKKRKVDFQDGCHGGHLGFPIGTILAIFDLQVTAMLPSKFGVNWPFGSGEEAKSRFSRWRPSWISDRHDFSYFWCTSHHDASYQVSSQLAQGCRRSRLL